MKISEVFLTSLFSVLNLTIPIIIGIILFKYKILTTQTRKALRDLNYYVVIPLFGLMNIIRAIRKDYLQEIGFIFLAVIPVIFLTFIIIFVTTLIFGIDIRIRLSYTFCICFGNFVVIPQILAHSICKESDFYSKTRLCRQDLIDPISSIPLIFSNVVYWVIGLPVLQYEKNIYRDLEKIYLVVLNYYKNIELFMKDTDFTNITELPHLIYTEPLENKDLSIVVIENESRNLARKNSVPINNQNFSDEFIRSEIITRNSMKFKREFYEKSISSYSKYRQIQVHFKKFVKKVFNTQLNYHNKRLIFKYVILPYKLNVKTENENLFSWKFYIKRILLSPPAIITLLAFCFGFISPIRSFFIGEININPVNLFIATLDKIGNMMTTLTLISLGTFIYEGTRIKENMLISKKLIIISNILKNLVIPSFGLFWVFIVIRYSYPEIYQNSPVLIFLSYSYWAVPNGLVLITMYSVAEYFGKEFAILSVYMNTISLGIMPLFFTIFFILYDL